MKKLVKFIEENAINMLIVFVVVLVCLFIIGLATEVLNEGNGDYERERSCKCNCCCCKECDE